MFRCKIVELPTSNKAGVCASCGMGVASGRLMVWGDETLFNQDLQPLCALPEKMVYGPQCTEQGIWLNEQGIKNETCISKLVSPDGDVLKKQRSPVFSSAVTIPGCSLRIEQFHRYDNAYLVRSDDAGNVIKKEFLAYVSGGRMSFVCHQAHVFVRDGSGNLICFDFELNEVWRHATSKQISTRSLVHGDAMALGEWVIFNLGETFDDAHSRRSDFEVVALDARSGKVVWQHVFDITKPEQRRQSALEQQIGSVNMAQLLGDIDQRYGSFTMSKLFGDKVYVCLYGRLLRLDAKTGAVELDALIPYETFDGKPIGITHVYPVKQGLLCFNRRGHHIELRTADAQTVLQTIELQHGYCPDSLPLEHEGKLVFSLLHQHDFENYIKLGFAVLTPDVSAPAVLTSSGDERPPMTVETLKDGRKFGNLVRMGGTDTDKILRYGEIVLRELAFRQGWSKRLPTSNAPAILHNGILHLQIDYSALKPSTNSEADWLKKFSVIQERVSACLAETKLRTGNQKGFYAVSVSVAPSATAVAGLPVPLSSAHALAGAIWRVNSKAHFSWLDMAAVLAPLKEAGWSVTVRGVSEAHPVDHWRLVGAKHAELGAAHDVASWDEDQLQTKLDCGELFAVDLQRDTQTGFAELCEREHGIRERNLFLDRVPAKAEKVLAQCRYHYRMSGAPAPASPEWAQPFCHALWDSLAALVGHAKGQTDYKSYQVIKQDRPALREAALVLLRPLLTSNKKPIDELDAKKLLARIKTGLRQRVLFYDPECINNSGDYSSVLEAHLRQIGLEPAVTSLSDVYDSLNGTVTINFLLHEQPIEWCFEQDSDWVDAAFYTQLVALVEAHTDGTLVSQDSSDQSQQSIYLEKPIAAYLCEAGVAQILA